MSRLRSPYMITRTVVTILLAATVAVAVVTCVGMPGPMTHRVGSSCAGLAREAASAPNAAAVALPPFAAVPATPVFASTSSDVWTLAPVKAASLGVPLDDPLHCVLLI